MYRRVCVWHSLSCKVVESRKHGSQRANSTAVAIPPATVGNSSKNYCSVSIFVLTAVGVPTGAICCAHGTVAHRVLNYTLSNPICQTCSTKFLVQALCGASRGCSLLHLRSPPHPVVDSGACISQQLFSIHFIE